MTKGKQYALAVTAGQGGSSHHTQAPAFDLFHAGGGDAYVDICVDGHRETYPVSSKVFRQQLTLMAFGQTRKMPNAAELKRRIELAQAKAVQPSPEHEVHVHIALAHGHNMPSGDSWTRSSWDILVKDGRNPLQIGDIYAVA